MNIHSALSPRFFHVSLGPRSFHVSLGSGSFHVSLGPRSFRVSLGPRSFHVSLRNQNIHNSYLDQNFSNLANLGQMCLDSGQTLLNKTQYPVLLIIHISLTLLKKFEKKIERTIGRSFLDPI